MSVNWTNPNPPRPDQIDLAQPVDWSNPQARGLAAYYPFFLFASPASARDMPLRRYVLTPYGSPTMVADGEFGKAGRLIDTSSQYYYNASTPVAGVPFTLAGWFKPSRTTGLENVAELYSGTKEGHYLCFNGSVAGDPVSAASIAGGSYLTADTSTGFVADRWQHACGVWASATSRSAYLNGGGKGTNSGNNNPALASQLVGAYYDGTTAIFANGRLGEVRIYNRALTDAEVYNLWHPSTRWAMLRTVSRRRVFVLPTATTSPWFFRNFILRRGRSA